MRGLFSVGRTPGKGKKNVCFRWFPSKGCGNGRKDAETIREGQNGSPNLRNDKALNNQGFGGTNMAEAMGFELMDLLQSTVFKSDE